MILLLIPAGLWLITGALAYGLTLAWYAGEFRDTETRAFYRRHALWTGVQGPVGILIAMTRPHPLRYGLAWWRP